MPTARSISPSWAPSQTWLWVGMPGVGKTTGADLFVDVLTVDGAIALIRDPHGENQAGKGYRGKFWHSVGAFRVASTIERRNVFRFVDPFDLLLVAVELGLRGVRVVYVEDEGDGLVGLGNTFFDDDKAHIARIPPDVRRRLTYPNRGLVYNIINTGRHLNVAFVVTARRPADLGTRFRANARGVFLLRLSEEGDLDWVRACTDSATRAAVGALPEFEGVLWSKFDGTHRFSVSPRGIVFRR